MRVPILPPSLVLTCTFTVNYIYLLIHCLIIELVYSSTSNVRILIWISNLCFSIICWFSLNMTIHKIQILKETPKNLFWGFSFKDLGYPVVPQYPQGICSRTRHGYQNPRMFKSHSPLFSGSEVLHPWIQTTTLQLCCTVCISWKKSI